MAIYVVNNVYNCTKSMYEERTKLEWSNSPEWSVRLWADRLYFVRNVVLANFQHKN